MEFPETLKPLLRPVDMARAAGLSTQAIRNYETEGVLPPARRLASGHRRYTQVHLEALRAFLALTRAAGRPQAVAIMRPLADRDLDTALVELDRVHARLLADRHTVDSLAARLSEVGQNDAQARPQSLSPIELARRIGVTTTTLRAWEKAGILQPRREQRAGRRRYCDTDIRDAELVHLLRRAGHGLSEIAKTIDAVRTHGGALELAKAVSRWRGQLERRARTLMSATAALVNFARQLGVVDDDAEVGSPVSINVPGQYT